MLLSRSRFKTRIYESTLRNVTQYQTEQRKTQQEELQRTNQALKNQTSEEELKQQHKKLTSSDHAPDEKTTSPRTQQVSIEAQIKQLETSKLVLQEQTEALKLAGQHKSEFWSHMSHQLRTPLNSMLLLAESMAANKEGNLNKSQIKSAAVIHKSGQNLLYLINEIHDLSKIEAGKITPNVEEVKFSQLVKILSQQFVPLAEHKNLGFHSILEDDLPSSIATDTQRLQQILKSLLTNAFKFTREGAVTLDIRSVSTPPAVPLVQLDPSQQRIIAFSVIDTGIGMAKDKHMRISEAFQHTDGTVSRIYGGTGLGLTISKELARLLGGEMQLVQSSEAGSVFTLYLPLESQAQNETVPITETPAVTPVMPVHLETIRKTLEPNSTPFFSDDRESVTPDNNSLLIIEDDAHFAGILADLAKQRGYHCLVTDRGIEGLALAEQHQPSAIVLDLGLPDADGTLVFDQLKSNMKTQHIPVHIVSARDPDPQMLRKGAVGFLTKPVKAEELDALFALLQTSHEARVRQILVVEDDHKNQLAIMDLINYNHPGIELTMADSGEEALQKLASNPYDCVILDLKLSGISGYEVLERLPTLLPDAPPPVIVYTGTELTPKQNYRLEGMAKSIVVKGSASGQRLIDDLTLLLRTTENSLPTHNCEVIKPQHDSKQEQQELLGTTVLIVDDDIRNIFSLSKVLSEVGIEIQSADNGQLGLDKLAADTSIDLIIMDTIMPVMDGIEAIRLIRAQECYRELPIIALTTKAMSEERENCLAAGASDCIGKPVDGEQLFALLRMWLQRQVL